MQNTFKPRAKKSISFVTCIQYEWHFFIDWQWHMNHYPNYMLTEISVVDDVSLTLHIIYSRAHQQRELGFVNQNVSIIMYWKLSL